MGATGMVVVMMIVVDDIGIGWSTMGLVEALVLLMVVVVAGIGGSEDPP